ncbi:sugar phosphate isomerase/epimerase [Paenibacillus castaneae]|uniref:S-layer homology domain-containing protein n=1 Tax=Paenibacillus castaneae TaxID=474957 RepID=UPI000C9A2391|nr:S-layer homology domain-containing protein [Paenibacillus castaneae]NIK77812.1 sugar phosphate isomerase/epimerase [Paenibacillus castaneae]
MFKKGRKGFSLMLAALIVLSSVQLTWGARAEAASADGEAVIIFNTKETLLELLAKQGYDAAKPEEAEQLKSIVIHAGTLSKTLANADFIKDNRSLSKYVNLESFRIVQPAASGQLAWNGNKLPNNAFKGLAKLKKVDIGIDTSYIGAGAFDGCVSLETAVFGMTRTLGPYAFKNNSSLTSLTFNKTYLPIGLDPDADTGAGDWFAGADMDNLTVYVPTDAVAVFQSDDDWSSFGFTIASNGDNSPKDVDNGPTATQEVEIQSFTTKKLKDAIDASNFEGKDYSDIKTLTIKGGVLDPADCTFIATSLKKLEELYIIGTANFTNSTIPKNAFEGNRYLKKVKAENVKTIGVKAFNLFENLTEVDFPDVELISSQAFAQTKGSSASKLKVARFPNVKTIESRAFYFCVNLTDLYLGENPPTLTVPEGKQGLWFNFVTNMTIHVPSLEVYNEYIKVEHSDQMDWSAMSFVADNGDQLPTVPPAEEYVDSNYDHLRLDHTVPYYNGDYKLSLNMYTFNMNVNSWIQGRTSPVPMTTFEAIKWAHDNGFDAVDITCYYIPGYSNTAMPPVEKHEEIFEFARQIKKYADDLGIEISGTGIQNNFAEPNQARRELDIERIKFWTKVANEMGAPVIRIFSGPPPVDIRRLGWDEIARDRIAPAIQEVADFAAKNYPNVEIGVQNHGDMLATANQVLQLLQWIDRPNVGVVNDTGYYREFMNTDATQYDWYTDIGLILPYSNNFQVKKKPGGAETQKLMDLNKVFETIRSSSYRGYIPVELLWNPEDEGYPGKLNTPPYEETLAFLGAMKKAMKDTVRKDIYSDLKDIRLSTGALKEDFTANTLHYTQQVANNVSSVQVTPAAAESEAIITVNGNEVVSGQASEAITLNTGVNTITIVVAGADQSSKTYTIAVTRDSASSGSSGGDGGSPVGDTVTSTNGQLNIPIGKIGIASLGDGLRITFPAGAAADELKITIEQVKDTSGLLSDQVALLSPVYEMLKNIPQNFKKLVKIEFAFDSTLLKNSERAGIFYYDEAKKQWVEVMGSKVTGNQIAGEVDHFTKFAVLAVDKAAAVESFSDIAGHWAAASISEAVKLGIVSGYPDHTFRPNRTVTRAEFAVMLTNALQMKNEGAELKFNDSAKIGEWAKQAIATANHAGIIQGFEDGSFRPNEQIKRSEMAVMIARALKLSTETVEPAGFADDLDVPLWAMGAVASLKQQGIIQGNGSNTFAPKASATRAEAVTILLNMVKE